MPYPHHLSYLNRTPEQRAAHRRARHRRWRDSLSDRDWARIGELVDQVTPTFTPARLDDLDAPGIAVGVMPETSPAGSSGERIGTLRGVAVLVWEK